MAQTQSENLQRKEGNLEATATPLLQAVESGSGRARFRNARQRLTEDWEIAKGDLGRFRQIASDYSQSAVRATNTYAHDHPWQTAGAAIGVGALIGWLVSRQR